MITVDFAADWKEQHPLTMTDLQQESENLNAIGLLFRVIEPESD